MSNDLVKPGSNGHDPVKGLAQYLNARQKNLAQFAAARTKPETLIRLALFQFSQDEWLRRTSPESIYASLILAAQIGLEPSGIRGEAYLVPFKGKCTLIPGWRGLVKLALRSKAVKSIYSHVVYERDEFDPMLGTEPKIIHRPYLAGPAGEIIAAYAVARFENGEVDVEIMSRDELEYVERKASESRGGKAGPAYEDWRDQMWRKAPIRRGAKRWPCGDDFYLAAKLDELHEAGKPEEIARFLDVEATEVSESSGDIKTDLAAKLGDKAAAARAENESR